MFNPSRSFDMKIALKAPPVTEPAIPAGKDDLFLTPKEAAAYLRVSKSYLDKLRVYGGGPRFLRFGRKILYQKSDLNFWAGERCFGSSAEY
jgi:excisionase family DNA binding protein